MQQARCFQRAFLCLWCHLNGCQIALQPAVLSYVLKSIVLPRSPMSSACSACCPPSHADSLEACLKAASLTPAAMRTGRAARRICGRNGRRAGPGPGDDRLCEQRAAAGRAQLPAARPGVCAAAHGLPGRRRAAALVQRQRRLWCGPVSPISLIVTFARAVCCAWVFLDGGAVQHLFDASRASGAGPCAPFASSLASKREHVFYVKWSSFRPLRCSTSAASLRRAAHCRPGPCQRRLWCSARGCSSHPASTAKQGMQLPGGRPGAHWAAASWQRSRRLRRNQSVCLSLMEHLLCQQSGFPCSRGLPPLLPGSRGQPMTSMRDASTWCILTKHSHSKGNSTGKACQLSNVCGDWGSEAEAADAAGALPAALELHAAP